MLDQTHAAPLMTNFMITGKGIIAIKRAATSIGNRQYPRTQMLWNRDLILNKNK